jgi:hypothetical protein
MEKSKELLAYECPMVDIVSTEGITLLSGSNRGNAGDPPGPGESLVKGNTMFDDNEGDEPDN